MTSIVGHAANRAAFAAACDGGAVHHAWLLAGPAGVGKATFARAMGLQLMGGGEPARGMIEVRSHPDYKLVEREVWVPAANPARIMPYADRNGDELPARGIRIAQVRDLQRLFTRPPSVAEWRVVVIDSVDDLEPPAANALLKSLEEPPAKTVFLLVSHTPGTLLPTIRSRCRLLRFGLLADAEVEAVVRIAQPLASDAETAALVRAGEGSPGRALGFAGLDIVSLDSAIAAIAGDGDPDNIRRAALARTLAVKAAQPRYEAFLDRAAAFVAAEARQRSGPALAATLAVHARARDLVGAALGLSLDVQATVWEMAGLLAALPR